MALPSSYNTGTASVPANSTAVTGQSTNWLTSGLQAGDIFIAGGLQAEIASVNSNTSITLADPWPGTTRTTDTYRARFVGDMTRGLTAMNAVLSSITNGILYAFSALASAANKIAYFTGAGTMALADFTAHARAILALSGGNGKFIRSTGTNTAVMQDIVGTVAQSGGTPTGAIVETGTNANGTYTRYADGTQICSMVVDITSTAITTASGNVFVPSAQIAVIWPAAFTAAPSVTGSVQRGVVLASGIHGYSVFATTAGIVPWSSVSLGSSVSKNLHIQATGRWFA